MEGVRGGMFKIWVGEGLKAGFAWPTTGAGRRGDVDGGF